MSATSSSTGGDGGGANGTGSGSSGNGAGRVGRGLHGHRRLAQVDSALATLYATGTLPGNIDYLMIRYA